MRLWGIQTTTVLYFISLQEMARYREARTERQPVNGGLARWLQPWQLKLSPPGGRSQYTELTPHILGPGSGQVSFLLGAVGWELFPEGVVFSDPDLQGQLDRAERRPSTEGHHPCTWKLPRPGRAQH